MIIWNKTPQTELGGKLALDNNLTVRLLRIYSELTDQQQTAQLLISISLFTSSTANRLTSIVARSTNRRNPFNQALAVATVVARYQPLLVLSVSRLKNCWLTLVQIETNQRTASIIHVNTFLKGYIINHTHNDRKYRDSKAGNWFVLIYLKTTI